MGAFLISLLSSGLAMAAGFSTGSEYTAVLLDGEVTVRCTDSNGRPQSEYYSCRSETLDPVEWDYFVGDEGVAADKVTLTNTVKGKGRSQTKDYDNGKSRSEKHFNLWVATLFQRPLLGFGENKIRYEMKSGRETVKSGEFIVKVNEGERRVCRYRSYHTTFSCESRVQICEQYFRDENYCL